MFEFEKPRIEIAEMAQDGTYGRFVVEPLERGYGTTLGNSLRRIMLSSLPGLTVFFMNSVLFPVLRKMLPKLY